MWLPRSALERIRELEALLRDSVPQGVHKDALARIAELERQAGDARVLSQSERASVESRLLERIMDVERQLEDERREHNRQLRWFHSMLLRREGSIPLPPTPEEKAAAKQDEPPPEPSETAIAQAEAIVEEARRRGVGRQETEDALRDSIPGITEEAIARAVSGRVM